MKKFLSIAAVAAVLFTSCSDDDNEKNNVENPATYTFTRNGESTVNFGGQTTRIAMATELVSALSDNTKTKVQLQAMFNHQAGNADFTDANLNSSDKNVRSKVAASNDFFASNTTVSNTIKADFDAWISEQADNVFVSWNVTAQAGVAGKLQQLGSTTVRYFNAKGLELNQAVAKGLIGGLMADQMLNNYLSDAVLDAGSNMANNDNDVVEVGKTYTTMEHKWDEAYGYLYGAEENPESPVLDADRFLNTYLRQVNDDADFAGIADEVYQALKLGRAAIVAKNYTVRDAQVKVIRENISKAIAVRAVHYLQGAKSDLEAEGTVDYAHAFHELSEGFGFVYSLQFTRKPETNAPYFSHEEVNAYVDALLNDNTNGFWDVTPETLDTISAEIAAEFGFTVEAAAN
ncbi:DUF4856 domain-containing protein [Aestuariibaculum suncheonense]|uniref:DUF4856 domain-containing protein n=1 Tax=Aestuariibaculum suncheonense TaxID=1028745 RepID=A0A8J6QMU2_9FLAO|nr:DUF4856 domain-containing protein [Aestuariibaculum suncheonense]MBD0836886.1 DUF4856 domain-containing protein [Aestuariibaculum suncheonense]